MMLLYSLVIKVRIVKNFMYTRFIKLFLGSVGSQSYINYPCRLEGEALNKVHIGSKTKIDSHCVIGCRNKYRQRSFNPEIIIGDKCNIGEYNHITAINKITIGNGFLTGRFVTISDNNHGGLFSDESNLPPADRNLSTKGEVVIGNNVWLGDKVTILSGVHIGDNVIVGANTVVTKDLPSNTVWGGAKFRLLKAAEQKNTSHNSNI